MKLILMLNLSLLYSRNVKGSEIEERNNRRVTRPFEPYKDKECKLHGNIMK